MRAARGFVIVLLVACGFALSACGDDEPTTATEDSVTAEASVSAQDPASPDNTTPPDNTAEPENPAPPKGTATPEDSAPAATPAGFHVHLLPAEGDDCTTTVTAERQAQAQGTVGDALAQLLAGLSSEEEAAGLHSWFSSETAGMLNDVKIDRGLAEVDFANFSAVIPNASTSCGSQALLAQLEHTVLQFPEIDRVIYSFDGDRAAFYEWLQLSAPE